MGIITIDSRKMINAARSPFHRKALLSPSFWLKARAEAETLESVWGYARHVWRLGRGPCSPGPPSLEEAAEYWGVGSAEVVDGQEEDFVLAPAPGSPAAASSIAPGWRLKETRQAVKAIESQLAQLDEIRSFAKRLRQSDGQVSAKGVAKDILVHIMGEKEAGEV